MDKTRRRMTDIPQDELEKIMIEYGLEMYKKLEGNDQSKSPEPQDKNTKYIIKIFGITSEILRCVYNKEKTKHGAETADEAIKKIESIVKDFLEEE